MRLFRLAAAALSFAGVLSGCSIKKEDTSKLQIRFARPSSSKVSAMSFPVGRQLCFAVNVSAEDIDPVPATSCSPKLGQFSSFVPEGGVVSLEVKKGGARTVEVLAYLFDSGATGECPAWTVDKVKDLNYSRVYSVGKTLPVDFLNSEENVSIDASFPGLSNDIATTSSMDASSCPNLAPAGGTGPSVTLASGASNPTNAASISITATFSASVTGVTASDFVVGNGSVTGFTGTGTTYTFGVTPTSDGNVTVDLPAGAATDGSGNSSSAAAQLLRVSDRTAPGVTTIAGITGGTDSTANAWLTNGVFATVNWSNVTGETGYVVKIRDAADSVDVCTPVTAAQDATSHTFTGCTLVEGTSYKVNVSAIDAASNATPASNDLYAFTIDGTAPSVSAFAVTNANPTNTTTYSLSSTLSGTYTDYCILENSTTVASCTWTTAALPASYTVTSTNNAKVLSVWLKDAAGNVSSRVDAGSVTLDTTAPSIPSGLALQSPATTPSNDTTPTIRISGVTSGDSVKMFTDSSCSTEVASGTAAGSTIDLTSSTLGAGSYNFYSKAIDPLTNASACSTATVAYTINLTAPAVLNVSASSSDGSYGLGATVSVTVQFSEAVTVTGTPTLTLETGSSDRTASYASGSGTTTLSFDYTVQSGDVSADLDYLSTSALSLAGGSIIGNTTSNAADLTLPSPGGANSLSANKALVIDSTAPGAFNISGVTGSVDTTADAWFTASGAPTIEWATASGASSYDVTIRDSTNASDVCATENSTGLTHSLAGCSLVDGTTYKILVVAKDAAGNTTSATNDALSFTVDRTAPATFTVTGATGNAADTTANAWLTDASSPVTANWNDTTGETGYSVSIRNAADTADVCAAEAVVANATSHEFGACVMIEGSTYLIKVLAYDAAGNERVETSSFTVDTLAPSITGFTVTTASPTQSTTFALTFTATGSPSHYCILENDTDSGNCSWNASALPATFVVDATNETKTLSAWLKDSAGNVTARTDANSVVLDTVAPSTPTAIAIQSPASPGNDTTPLLLVSGVTVGDTIGIYSDSGCTTSKGSATAAAATVTITSSVIAASTTYYAKAIDPAGNSSSCTSGASYVLDTTAPTVLNVTSAKTNGSYTVGEVIEFSVQFSEAVVVSGGTPTLLLETGTTDRTASYSSGSNSDTLTFQYTVQAGDTSSDLDYHVTSPLSLNSATIRDTASNSATLTLATPGAANSISVSKALVIDTTAPGSFTITGLTGGGDSVPDGYLSNANPAVNWNTSTGATSYNVTIRNAGDTADVCSTVNTAATSYTFSGCTLSDGVSYIARVVAKDAANNLTTSSNSPFGFIVDMTAPTVTAFSVSNPAVTNSTTFNLTFTASGTPTHYCIRENDTTVGSCSWTVLPLPSTFVVSGTNNAKVLSAWVKDAAGNVSSIANSASKTLDTTAPSTPSALALFSPATSPGNDSSPTIQVSGVASGDTVTLYTNGTCATYAGSAVSAGSTVDVTATTLGSDGTYVYYAKNMDVAGNLSACSTANVSYQLDTEVPTISNVTSSKSDGAYTVGTGITISVTFSKTVVVAGGPPFLVLETGGTDYNASYAGGSGTPTLTFSYTVQAGDVSADLEYQSQSAFNLNGATIRSLSSTGSDVTLPALGGAGSLGLNKALVIDTTAPGSFAVSGITGGSDSTADNVLSSGYVPTVGWGASSGATSYDVSIRNAGDTADVCAATNWASYSATLTGCTLAGSTSYVAKVVAKDTAGNQTPVSYSFSVSSPDITPNVFSFTNVTNSALNTVNNSVIVQITGISTSANVSIVSGLFRICTDATCTANPTFASGPTTIANGQYLQLQVTSSATASFATSTTVTVGDAPVTWTVTTADDNTPSPFSFISTSQPPFTMVTSPAVQILGITGNSTMVSVSGPPGAEFRICDDVICSTATSWGTSNSPISSGKYVQARVETPATYSASGNVTVTVGGGGATWNVSSIARPPGYFVLSSATYLGAIGGLAGANTNCLSNLTSNSWLGKENAGTLDGTRVKAFLCDGTTCNNLVASMPYSFAVSNSPAVGGSQFTTNASAQGPGDSTAWSGTTYFNSTATVWTGRAIGTGTLWPTTPDGTNHCTNWTSSAGGGNKGQFGTLSSTTTTRWNAATAVVCSGAKALICAVAPPPGAPKAFKFTDITGATPSTLYASEILQMRVPEPLTLSIAGGDFRVCSDSACSSVVTTWGTASTTLYDNQYLQVRATSGAAASSLAVTLNLGAGTSIWTIETTGVSGSWASINPVGAPSPRRHHVSAWTGSEMIVFGGESGTTANDMKFDGAKYNPTNDTWTPMAAGGTLTQAKAVFTGTELLVWGGYKYSSGSKVLSSSGARYNPTSDTWTPMNASGPTARVGHSVVWTGTEFIVWGGFDGSAHLSTGARYNPSTDIWSSMATAPNARGYHTAIWTGSEMIVHGGIDASTTLATTMKYNPTSDTWTALSSSASAMKDHAVAFDGSKMFVRGTASGVHDVAANTWVTPSSTNAPPANSNGSAVWTGSKFIVYGGSNGFNSTNDFGAYDPSSDTWMTGLGVANGPGLRDSHSAVWTGSKMLIWGGAVGSVPQNSGAAFTP